MEYVHISSSTSEFPRHESMLRYMWAQIHISKSSVHHATGFLGPGSAILLVPAHEWE